MDRLTNFPLPLVTPRLIIRPPRLDAGRDAALFFQAVQDSMLDIKPYLGWVTDPYTMYQATGYVDGCVNNWQTRSDNDTGLSLWIMDSKDQAFIGHIVIWNIDWQLPKCELGFWINHAYAGQGFMHEALYYTTYLCLDLGMQRVEVRCENTNQRVHHLMHQLNFKLDGILPKAVLGVKTRLPTDVALYSCTEKILCPKI